MQFERIRRLCVGEPNVELAGVGEDEVPALQKGKRRPFSVNRLIAIGHPNDGFLRLREPYGEAIRIFPYGGEPCGERSLGRRNYYVFVGFLDGEGEWRGTVKMEEEEEEKKS
ncbi:hypothetical protein CR513_11923, partial [Mucuna pruriens]